MVNGEIWANVWQSECIARIDPASGAVRGWVLMHGLGAAVAARALPMRGKRMDVLNGARRVRVGAACARSARAGGSAIGTRPAAQGANRRLGRRRTASLPPPSPTRAGIAWDAERRRLFVTGKYWPRVFEVTVHAVSPNSDAHKARVRSCFVG